MRVESEFVFERWEKCPLYPGGRRRRFTRDRSASRELIECLARSGEVKRARARLLLEKTLGYANHLGLVAEELSPSGEHLGNFSQAFTHLALISAAFELNRRLDEKGKG